MSRKDTPAPPRRDNGAQHRTTDTPEAPGGGAAGWRQVTIGAGDLRRSDHRLQRPDVAVIGLSPQVGGLPGGRSRRRCPPADARWDNSSAVMPAMGSDLCTVVVPRRPGRRCLRDGVHIPVSAAADRQSGPQPSRSTPHISAQALCQSSRTMLLALVGGGRRLGGRWRRLSSSACSINQVARREQLLITSWCFLPQRREWALSSATVGLGLGGGFL